ncbi:pyruvate kinase, partial [Flavobacteriaceae bacterium]|nr:pyruvate kinase [Flavobacteriaceae bacterium]
TDQTILDLNEMAKKAGYVSEGDTIINLASMPIKERGMVNTLRVSSI